MKKILCFLIAAGAFVAVCMIGIYIMTALNLNPEGIGGTAGFLVTLTASIAAGRITLSMLTNKYNSKANNSNS